MERLKPFLYCLVGFIFVFLVYKAYFADEAPPTTVSDMPASLETAISSSSSSLNLIVRVSPLLRKQKTASARSSLTPEKSLSTAPYELYTSAESIRGKRVVFFFVSEDDPFSLDHHAFINDLVTSGFLKVPTFRVDFATSTAARLAYGVIVPDTFVVLDESGRPVQTIIHPGEAELRALLTASH